MTRDDCAGDKVKEDDILLQIETDKVTIDVRYTEAEAGVVKEYLVAEEDTVTVGQNVCVVDKGAAGAEEEGRPYPSPPTITAVSGNRVQRELGRLVRKLQAGFHQYLPSPLKIPLPFLG